MSPEVTAAIIAACVSFLTRVVNRIYGLMGLIAF